ncbi:MAG: helix-turn-helix domain-containing protein, partial [Spirochaetaceae bacterium]|nr:helix-turn-helix domain-containing protein [Spirochaetaceae bacterium]
MTEKSEVIRRLRAGQSIREINRETGIHRSTVRNIREVATRWNWLDSRESLPGESEILKSLRNDDGEENLTVAHPLDIYLSDIEGWLKEK